MALSRAPTERTAGEPESAAFCTLETEKRCEWWWLKKIQFFFGGLNTKLQYFILNHLTYRLLSTGVRRQRGPAPASCARLQSRQLPAHAGDTRADQGLVADEPEGEADQDRREGRQPRPLRRIPDGRGRYPPANVRGDFAAHRRTTAAAATNASVRRSIIMCSRATDRRSASKC